MSKIKSKNSPTINLNLWLQKHPEFSKKFNKNKEISFLKKNLAGFVIVGVILWILISIFYIFLQ